MLEDELDTKVLDDAEVVIEFDIELVDDSVALVEFDIDLDVVPGDELLSFEIDENEEKPVEENKILEPSIFVQLVTRNRNMTTFRRYFLFK